MSDFYIQDGVLKDYLGPGSRAVSVPEGVTEIGPRAFCNEKSGQGYRITGVTLPEGVAQIGEYAFYNCTALASAALPEGLERIGLRAFRGCGGLMEIVLPDSVEEVAAGSFSDCKALSAVTLSAGLKRIEVNAFRDCVSLKRVRIPDGVASIRSMAFCGCRKLERVEVPASVQEIFSDAFLSCPRLVLLAPHLAPQDMPASLRIPMALGFCANPERFSGETAKRCVKYAGSHRNEILKAAGKLYKESKRAVMAYYGVKPVPRGPRNANAGPYAKLSEQKKVLLLEETVLSGDMEKLEEVLTGCKAFECTARALGLACRFGSLEAVRRLVQAGASFNYTKDASLTGKYGLYTVYRGFFGAKTVYHRFEYLLTEDDLNNEDRVGDLRNIRDHLCADGRERPPAAETQRVEILRWLAHTPEAGCNCAMLLCSAILDGKPIFAEALMDEDAAPDNYDLSGCPDSKLIAAANKMLDAAKRQGVKMPVNLPLLKRVREDVTLVARLLDEGSVPETLNTTEFLKSSLEAKSAGTLALCLERGFLKSKATREKLMEQCTAAGKTEHTAVLLEYINRNADLKKERAAEEARLIKDRTAAPDSVYRMKTLWRYRKQEDGTLCVTGYKGAGPEAAVPAKIGKAAAAAIGARAFSPQAERLREEEREARKTIQSVIVPGSVQRIGREAFQDCVSLTGAVLPEALKTIEHGLFRGCKALTGIVIPEGVTVLEAEAFESCGNLMEITLPASLREIGYQAFSSCRALTHVTLPRKLRSIGSNAFWNCGLEEITIPGSVRQAVNAFRDCRHLREVVIERGVTALWYGVFSGCGQLRRITLPASVCEINQMAFGPNSTELVIRAPAGSYAEQYAKKNFYKFEAL